MIRAPSAAKLPTPVLVANPGVEAFASLHVAPMLSVSARSRWDLAQLRPECSTRLQTVFRLTADAALATQSIDRKTERIETLKLSSDDVTLKESSDICDFSSGP